MSTERSFKEQAMSVLEDVVDPELAVDIVNLGLIYNVELDNQGLCTVTMTLTIAGCPLTEYLNAAIEEELLAMDQVKRSKSTLSGNRHGQLTRCLVRRNLILEFTNQD